MANTQQRTGGELFTAALEALGADRVYCVPGESFLGALDAMYESKTIQTIPTRHESGAGLMAVADARLTGKPGVCMVTRGPGATNGALAVHVAEQDSVPMIMVIGQVERPNLKRGAFQEVDYGKFFGDMAKWVVEINDADRIPEFVHRAWYEATKGTPGPVVISVPEDVWTELSDASDLAPRTPARVKASDDQYARAADLIGKAKRPIILAGGACEPPEARKALVSFSEAWSIPVAATNKRQHIFPNDHENWVGHIGFVVPPSLSASLAEADLVIAAGTRLGDVSTQSYRFPKAPLPDQPILQIHPDPNVIGVNHQIELGLVSELDAALNSLAQAQTGTVDRAEWIDRLAATRKALADYYPSAEDDGLDFGSVVQVLADNLSDDAIVTADAGNFTSWMHVLMKFRSGNEFLGSVGGAMGFAIPSAVAAASRFPERPVISIVGDGGFMMTGYEIATAVLLGVSPKIFVSNNSSYGVIRSHQERDYPGRVVGTGLANPDFAALGRSFGATGITVESGDDVEAKVGEALSTKGLVVVDVKTSLNKLNMFQTISK